MYEIYRIGLGKMLIGYDIPDKSGIIIVIKNIIASACRNLRDISEIKMPVITEVKNKLKIANTSKGKFIFAQYPKSLLVRRTIVSIEIVPYTTALISAKNTHPITRVIFFTGVIHSCSNVPIHISFSKR